MSNLDGEAPVPSAAASEIGREDKEAGSDHIQEQASKAQILPRTRTTDASSDKSIRSDTGSWVRHARLVFRNGLQDS